MEPHKCDDISWHPLGKLPPNMVPGVKAALEHYRAGQTYAEYGWQQ